MQVTPLTKFERMRFALATFALLLLPSCGIGLCINESSCRAECADGNCALLLTLSPLTVKAVEMDESSITLSWLPANATPSTAATLTYSVYYSTSPNLLALAEVPTNGTLAGTVTGETQFKITALTLNQNYYFSVIVTAPGGEQKLYPMRTPYCGGDGTSGDPYQICDPGSLQWMAVTLRGNFILTADIDLSGTPNWNSGKGWTPVGKIWPDYFEGTLDGRHHHISYLYINRSGEDRVSLLGVVGDTASVNEVNNLTLDYPRVAGGAGSGALASSIYGGNGTQLNVDQGSVSGTGYVGLLVGGTQAFGLSDCRTSGTVRGAHIVGGLTGRFYGGDLSRSYSTANVLQSGAGYGAGGLVGELVQSNTNLYDVYATGNVHGTFAAGGLIGALADVGPGVIQRCYATGNVSATTDGDTFTIPGDGDAGGLLGAGNNGRFENCFATGNVQSPGEVGALIGNYSGPTPLNSVYFAHPFTPANCATPGNAGCTSQTNPTWFYDITHYDGGPGELNWDFSSTGAWILPATGKYPVLRWQAPNRPVEFPPEFRNGRKIGYSDMAAYRVWGFCSTPGATISFSGPNAPGNTVCNGGTWTTNWDFSAQGDGNIDITVQEGTSPVVQRRLVKDTDSCGLALNDETIAGLIDARFILSSGPHIACNKEQIAQISANVGNLGKDFTLGSNIDMTAYAGTPIGQPANEYYGTFDGDGFMVRNLSVATVSNGGLFGSLSGAIVRNIGIENASVSSSGGGNTGVLAGSCIYNFGLSRFCEISNAYSTGFVSGPASSTGGLVSAIVGSIDDSFSSSDVIGSVFTGGLVGSSFSGYIANSRAMGDVRGTSLVGGLVGSFSGLGKVQRSSASGRTSGSQASGNDIGGLAGTITQVETSYATGSVHGVNRVGGLSGSGSGTFQNSYAAGGVFGLTDVGGLVGRAQATAVINASFATGSAMAVTSDNGGLVGEALVGAVLTGSFYHSASSNSTCVGNNNGSGATCSGIASASLTQNASPPLSLWDFATPVWAFLTSGGLPILQWQVEP